jgi:hypothetical protein
MDWLRWWYNHVADIVPLSTALASGTKMSEKCKSTSSSAVWVKNGRKTISTTEKLDVIRRLEKGKRIVDICLNVTLAFISLRIIRDTAGIICRKW